MSPVLNCRTCFNTTTASSTAMVGARTFFTPSWSGTCSRSAIARAGITDAAGRPLRYTPHDFRRMFATEAVTGGLPVHTAAKVLGHANINTTQSYTAVFPGRPHPHLPHVRQPTPSHASQRGIPRTDRCRMGRVPTTLPPPQARTRRLRTALRHTMRSRARLLNRNNLGRQYGTPKLLLVTKSDEGDLGADTRPGVSARELGPRGVRKAGHAPC
ncbi:tyrosine-type recombinase/integrase [Micromonospora deserti]|uniref:tyrosine-type recombinase/integrase n=1 Tax=Micromonospora deserti TaxID=2070366 RepID=UPI0018F5DE49|nr:tyrosine-type recombinase/integrase [Micromonospora deserti]